MAVVSKTEIVLQLESVLQQYLNDQNLTLTEELSADHLDGWDSLTQISVLSEVEKKFGIRVAPEEMALIERVGDMVKLIQNKLT